MLPRPGSDLRRKPGSRIVGVCGVSSKTGSPNPAAGGGEQLCVNEESKSLSQKEPRSQERQ